MAGVRYCSVRWEAVGLRSVGHGEHIADCRAEGKRFWEAEAVAVPVPVPVVYLCSRSLSCGGCSGAARCCSALQRHTAAG